jgi:hypothetical protein
MTLPSPVFRSALALAACALLAACGGTRPMSVRAEGEFPRENLRRAPSLLAVSTDAKVIEFKGAVAGAFGRSDSLATFIARALADSLNRGTPVVPVRRATWSAPADSAGLSMIPGPDSSVLEKGARYVLRVRDITVTNARRELPVVDVPGMGSSYARSGGGSSESCVVSFEVEIWDTEGVLSRKHAFVVTGRADLFLWAYESTLREAVRRAVQGAAAHLRG